MKHFIVIAAALLAPIWIPGVPVLAETSNDLRQRLDASRKADTERAQEKAEREERAHRRLWKVYRGESGLDSFELLTTGWKRSKAGAWYTTVQSVRDHFGPITDDSPLSARLEEIQGKPAIHSHAAIAVDCKGLRVNRKQRTLAVFRELDPGPRNGWGQWHRPEAGSAEEAVLIDRCSTSNAPEVE